MTKEFAQYISEAPKNKKHEEEQIWITAELDRFCLGKRYVNGEHIKRLDGNHENVWEFRIKRTPQYRIFGTFICENTFLVSHHFLRSKLGKKGSRQWNTAIIKVDKLWKRYFPTYSRFDSKDFKDYITNNGICNGW